MELLQFNTSEWKVELNKPWLVMIPEFNALIARDKGSPGDYRGQYKKKATADFSYMYLMMDWKSPLRNYEDDKKKLEAAKVFDYLDKPYNVDADEELQAAMLKYQEMLYRASRSLKTLHAIKNSLDDLDNYFVTVDFTQKDKQGKLLHNMKDYLDNIKKVRDAYGAIEEFEDKVSQDLQEAGSIASKHRELGIREREFVFEHKRREFTEGGGINMKLTENDKAIIKIRSGDDDDTEEDGSG